MKEYIVWVIEKLLALGFSRKAISLFAAAWYITTLDLSVTANIYKAGIIGLLAIVYAVTQAWEDNHNPTITLDLPTVEEDETPVS